MSLLSVPQALWWLASASGWLWWVIFHALTGGLDR